MTGQTKKLAQLIAACWKDSALKDRLMTDSRAVLAEHGLPVSDLVELVVVENTESLVHLVVPAPPEGSRELSEEQRLDVARRSSWKLFDACKPKSRFAMLPPCAIPVVWRPPGSGQVEEGPQYGRVSDGEQTRRLVALLVASWGDDGLRSRFLEDAGKVMREHGIAFSNRLEIRAIEAHDGLVHVVLPPPPSGWRGMTEGDLVDQGDLGLRRVADANNLENPIVLLPAWWDVPVLTVWTHNTADSAVVRC